MTQSRFARFAPKTARYLLTAINEALPNARRLIFEAPLSASDGGEGGDFTVSIVDASGSAKGAVKLAGQLGGTATEPDVRGIRVNPAGTPVLLTIGAVADGEILTRSGSTLVGAGAPTLIPDASTSTKGLVRLADDLGTSSGRAVQANDTRLGKKAQITSSAPTTSNDTTQGYEVGSHWYDSSGKALYIATDVTTSAAKWMRASGATHQVFTTSGTWTPPAVYSTVRVLMIGGGGGGGSGRKGAAASARPGGNGGDGGGFVNVTLSAGTVGTSNVTVTVGTGGAAGAGRTGTSQDGNAGSDGNATTFGTFARARGGRGGGGGGSSSGTQVGGQGGGAGANGAATAGAAGADGSNGGGGGGAGGGITAGDVEGVGGVGGGYASYASGGGGTSGAVGGGTAGGAGSAVPSNQPLGGAGGGGSGGSKTSNVGAGGAGGLYGGGGGGGGAGTNSVSHSGPGGAGADGICIVIAE